MPDSDVRMMADASQNIRQAALEARQIVQSASPHIRARKTQRLLRVLSDAILSGPAWHDRPPVPGDYLTAHKGDTPEDWQSGPIDAESVMEYSQMGIVCRWYGPIPPDPK